MTAAPTGSYPVPVSSTRPEGVTISRIVISFLVRVPVLSEAITETEPRVSTEWRSFMTALRRAMACTPMASTSDRIAGRPSGTAATARETPSSRMSTASWKEETPLTAATTIMTTTAMPMTSTPRVLDIWAISRCNGEGSSAVSSSSVAMRPISVSMPVPVTTARPTPRATAVPLNTMLCRSPREPSSASGVTVLVTASDSPVSEASCTCSEEALIRRASAATASPSPSTRTSPGTRSAAGIVASLPSRSTVALAAVMSARAATASAALFSCTKPMTALASTISRMTTTSIGRPPAPSRSHAASEIAMAPNSR